MFGIKGVGFGTWGLVEFRAQRHGSARCESCGFCKA